VPSCGRCTTSWETWGMLRKPAGTLRQAHAARLQPMHHHTNHALRCSDCLCMVQQDCDCCKGLPARTTQSLPRCLCRAGTNILSTLKFKIYFCYPALRCDILYCGVSSTYLLHVIAMYCGQIVAWFGIDWHYAGHYKINVVG